MGSTAKRIERLLREPLQEREGLLVRAAESCEVGFALCSRFRLAAVDPFARGAARVGVGAPVDARAAVADVGAFACGFGPRPPLALARASAPLVAPATAFAVKDFFTLFVRCADSLVRALARLAELAPATVLAAHLRDRCAAAVAARLLLRLGGRRRALARFARTSRAACCVGARRCAATLGVSASCSWRTGFSAVCHSSSPRVTWGPSGAANRSCPPVSTEGRSARSARSRCRCRATCSRRASADAFDEASFVVAEDRVAAKSEQPSGHQASEQRPRSACPPHARELTTWAALQKASRTTKVRTLRRFSTPFVLAPPKLRLRI